MVAAASVLLAVGFEQSGDGALSSAHVESYGGFVVAAHFALGAELWLVWVALDPAVHRDGILPEVLFSHVPSLAGEVLADDVAHLGIRPPAIAVRPVAAVDHAVRTENAIEFIKPRPVEIKITRDLAAHPAEDFRDLDVDLRPFP